MDYDDNNVFAKILREEMPSHRVYEDNYTLAFMDIMPVSKGHTLVIPKSKCVNIFCLLYTSPSPRDLSTSRMPSSA